MDSQQSNGKGKVYVIAGVVVLVIIAAVVALSNKQSSDANSTAGTANSSQVDTTSNPENNAPTSTTDSGTATYKDGTYSADASYRTPQDTESIKVTLTLSSGVVTDSTVVSSFNTPEARQYQTDFANSYKSQVVGKKITDIKLGKISGSSLTPPAFNQAVSKIETAAQA
ncbi:MAG: hypothetical protein JWN38_626 [Candidatus Saccharibacteria bacterium]|nr:hypothetical protein [Candidatus Saccharibacteria bacterium]